MNAKRWFAWVCLAVMLVSEVFLFHANHARDAALDQLHAVQVQLDDANAKLTALQNSSAGDQTTGIANLHKQNDLLTAKVNALQQTVDRLQKESQQTAEHLTTARSALEYQQAHLQQLQTQQQQAAIIANASACINNLRVIYQAKLQWALEKSKNAADVPTAQDLQPYLNNGVLPICPDGGTYSLNAAGELPTCSIQGHVLPQQ